MGIKTDKFRVDLRGVGCGWMVVAVISLFALPLRGELLTASYLPWWTSSDKTTSYFTSGAFDEQVGMLSEVVYFGEFQFDDNGNIHYAGTNIASGEASHWYIDQMQDTIDRIRSVAPDTTLTFSIGGAGNSDSFAVVSSTADARETAASQVRAILDRYGFDGVDLDWEGNSIPADDATVATNYGLLAQTIAGELTGDESLSAAIQYNRYLAANAIEPYVDLIRVMTYDAPEHSAVGNHTSVEGTTYEIEQMIAQGVLAEVLGVGAAFYGKTLGAWSGDITYSDLDSQYFDANGVYLPDDLTEWNDKGFDSVDSIAAKRDLAETLGLQEIFSWNLSQDSFYVDHWLPLTTALAAPIPEPASVLLLLLGSVMCHKRFERPPQKKSWPAPALGCRP